MVLGNEFAAVRVRVDRQANGDRLAIEDLRSGRTFHLDPLELERMTTIRHEDLTWLVSPDRSWFTPEPSGPSPAGSRGAGVPAPGRDDG